MRQIFFLAGLVFAHAAVAQGHSHGGAAAPPGGRQAAEPRAPMPPEDPSLFSGEVREVDKAAARITLKHEAISVFDVPAKTAQYPVKDPSMLDHLRAGDRVRFTVVLQGRALVVTRILAVRPSARE